MPFPPSSVRRSLNRELSSSATNINIAQLLQLNELRLDGNTILHHLIVSWGRITPQEIEEFESLLNLGADPYIQNAEGKTVIDLLLDMRELSAQPGEEHILTGREDINPLIDILEEREILSEEDLQRLNKIKETELQQEFSAICALLYKQESGRKAQKIAETITEISHNILGNICQRIEELGETEAGRAILSGPIPEDLYGKTLLHVAALTNHSNGERLLTTLLQTGANPNIIAFGDSGATGIDHGGLATPLHNAVSVGNFNAVQILKDYGADHTIINTSSEDPENLLYQLKDDLLNAAINESHNRKKLCNFFAKLREEDSFKQLFNMEPLATAIASIHPSSPTPPEKLLEPQPPQYPAQAHYGHPPSEGSFSAYGFAQAPFGTQPFAREQLPHAAGLRPYSEFYGQPPYSFNYSSTATEPPRLSHPAQSLYPVQQPPQRGESLEPDQGMRSNDGSEDSVEPSSQIEKVELVELNVERSKNPAPGQEF